jgi:hypothetical protein
MLFLSYIAGSAGAGPFTPKPPFWERPTFFIWPAASADPAAEEARFAAEDPGNFAGVKKDMDRSRGTLTRTGGSIDVFDDVFGGTVTTAVSFISDLLWGECHGVMLPTRSAPLQQRRLALLLRTPGTLQA